MNTNSTITGTTDTGTARRPRTHRTRRGLAICAAVGAALATSAAAIAPSATASAASRGVFNTAECIPSYRSVVQDVEAYRSWSGEYVQLQGALVNQATGATIYSAWAVGVGATAHNAFVYRSVPRGTYNVFFRWASWDPTARVYRYSTWQQVTGANLQTYGVETQPGIFVGGASGRCSI